MTQQPLTRQPVAAQPAVTRPAVVRPVVTLPLVEAFARPVGQTDPLQRSPEAPDVILVPPPANAWADPHADVGLGAPAVEPTAPEPHAAAEPLERFTLREALLRRRLRPAGLVALAVGALVIGAGGAAAGVLLGSRTVVAAAPDAHLTEVRPAIGRPAGSVADIAARVLPSVVSIDVRVGSGGETGSGIVIDKAGYILTNNHVVEMAKDGAVGLTVVFNDAAQTRHAARIVGTDPGSDLAVIRVEGVAGLTVAALGDSASLRVGDGVIAIGSPLGLAGTVTEGIVSALHRPVRLGVAGTESDAVIDAIQTDAAVNPGNSGGPLVDAAGSVVGINTAIRTLSGDAQSSGSIGLGFAIPIDDARATAQTLIDHGIVRHATLGVNVRTATDGLADGAQVRSVAAGGPAAAAGIQDGDVIVAVGDRTVRSADELTVAVQRHAVGDAVTVSLLRSGKKLTVTATLAAG